MLVNLPLVESFAPSRGRELKSLRFNALGQRPGFAPSRGRELKFFFFIPAVGTEFVRPLAGAGIEIEQSIS